MVHPWPPPAPKLSAAPQAAPARQAPVTPAKEVEHKKGITGMLILFILGGLALYGLGLSAPPAFMSHFTVFVLAVFVGYMVIWNVTPALHTPLMSVTNAVSSIIIIGALIQISSNHWYQIAIAGFAVMMTSINIAGGFAVTQRMLQMFRK